MSVGAPAGAGTPLSGNEGKFKKGSSELEITHWTFSGVSDLHSYVSSKTGPRRRTIPGNELGTGTIEGKRMTDAPIEANFVNGDVVDATMLFGDSAGGIHASVVIGNLDFDVNPDSGELESFSCSFTTDGDWEFI